MSTPNLSILNNKEKIELISEIHESMETIEISDAIKATLDERLKRIENKTTEFLTLEQLRNRIDQMK